MTAMRTVSFAFLLGGWLALAAVPTTRAQQPQVDPELTRMVQDAVPDADGNLVLPLRTAPVGKEKDFERAKSTRIRQVQTYLKSEEALSDADQAIVKGWFYTHEFRVLTQTSPKDLEQLPTLRFELFKQWIYPIKHNTNHKMMIDLTLGVMQQIVTNNFHPAVRYTAMLIIGDLNEQEVVKVGGSANWRTPEPYSAALPFIIDRIENANSPDPVRVAALLSLLRHLEFEPHRQKESPIPAGTRTQLVNALLKVANAKTPPAKRTAEGHLWLRRRAVEGLGLASVNTAQPEVVSAIDTILKDNTEPLQLRFAAALALGRTNLPVGFKVDVNELARTLGTLAATGIKTEFDRLDKMDKVEAEHREIYLGLTDAGVPGGAGPGVQRGAGEGGPGVQPGAVLAPEVDPKSYRLEPLRKKLRYELYCVQTGLGHVFEKAAPAVEGAAPVRKGATNIAVTPAEKTAVKDILDVVNKVATSIEKNKIDYTLLKTEMKTGAKSLETTVAKFVPAAAAPAAPMPGVAPMPGAPMPKPAAPVDDLLGK